MPRPSRLAALALAFVAAAAAARGADSPRIGVFVVGDDAETAEARTGLDEALRLAGLSAATIERAAPEAEREAAAALQELRHEGVEVVVAVGRAAAWLAHTAVRDRPIVCAAVEDADAAALRRGGNACVAAGLDPGAAVAALRRAAPGLKRIGVFVPAGDEAARASARDLGGETDVSLVEAAGATPEARAGSAAARLVAEAFIRPRADAVWLPPSVTSADAAALAHALQGCFFLLVGSRRAHLDAGCAVVVRSDPRDLGSLSAVLARQVLDGADPGRIPVRRARRRLIEVNLPAARRLGSGVPLTLLAWADSIVRPWPVPR